jgi:hypothetical protein
MQTNLHIHKATMQRLNEFLLENGPALATIENSLRTLTYVLPGASFSVGRWALLTTKRSL